MTCIFCDHIKAEQILCQTKHFKVVYDINPIQTGHLLLISKEHYNSLTQLPQEVRHDLIDLEYQLVQQLEEQLPIDGVTRASNDKDLLDTETHFHTHLIPRVKEDGFWDKLEIEKINFDLETVEDNLKTITSG